MKAKVLKRTTLTCEPGSIVNISGGQFKALGNSVCAIEEKELDKSFDPVLVDPAQAEKPKRGRRKVDA